MAFGVLFFFFFKAAPKKQVNGVKKSLEQKESKLTCLLCVMKLDKDCVNCASVLYLWI